MDIKIVDFDPKYANDIYELEINTWGLWGDEAKITKVDKNEIILIALYDEKFAGLCQGFYLGDGVFSLYIFCIKEKYQKIGIGTLLMQHLMEQAKKKFFIKKFTTEVISVYGKANSQKLFENFGFKCTHKYEKYWGKKSPNVYCPQCNKQPCECDALIYELEIN